MHRLQTLKCLSLRTLVGSHFGFNFHDFMALVTNEGGPTFQVYLSLLKKEVKWTWVDIKSHATEIFCQIYRSESGGKVESIQECCRNVFCEDFSSLVFAKL